LINVQHYRRGFTRQAVAPASQQGARAMLSRQPIIQ